MTSKPTRIVRRSPKSPWPRVEAGLGESHPSAASPRGRESGTASPHIPLSPAALGASAPNLRLDNLPEVLTLRASFRAIGAQRLPALPTTALHGAWGRALKQVTCVFPERPACAGCSQFVGCAYPALFEVDSPGRLASGVTDRAPAPVLFAPERMGFPANFVALADGEELGIRVSLLGPAIAQRSLVQAILVEAGRRGLGVVPGEPTEARPELRIERFDRVEPAQAPTGTRFNLRFLTPVRLLTQGKLVEAVDAQTLWQSLTRRADALGALYGGGSVLGTRTEAPFEVAQARLKRVDVHRYSSRQHQRMTWPALVGELALSGVKGPARSLLAWGQGVQLGKGTTFGFGNYVLEAV